MTTPTEPGQPGDPTGGAGYGAAGETGGYGSMPPAPEQYGAPAPGYGGMPELATWPIRAQSALVDWFVPVLIADIVYNFINRPFGAILQLAALAWSLYQAYQQGATGQSMGKKWAGTRLLREQDGQVIGGGLGIGRAFVHILDGLPCGLGYLWPLWDAKRQTFADKIIKTVVVKG